MNKKSIALHQLNRAIKLFINEKDYICSITLSGAAEEILGRLVEHNGEISAVNELADSLEKITEENISKKEIRDKHLNNVRNSIKHFSNPLDKNVITNWEQQAIQLIARCCSNIVKLNIIQSEQVTRFIKWSGI